MPRFRNLSEADIRQKTSATDLVTEADEAAERWIARECRSLAPDALFLGEESVAADPALLDRLDDAELAIVVDPVDGTANFAAGRAALRGDGGGGAKRRDRRRHHLRSASATTS